MLIKSVDEILWFDQLLETSPAFTWYYLLVDTFNSKFSDEILLCDSSNETSPAILSNGTINWFTVLTLNSADEIL